jgi:hypothetical protein
MPRNVVGVSPRDSTLPVSTVAATPSWGRSRADSGLCLRLLSRSDGLILGVHGRQFQFMKFALRKLDELGAHEIASHLGFGATNPVVLG